MGGRILCLLPIFILVSCSGVKVYEAGLGRELTMQQDKVLHKWQLQGRLSIKSDDLLTANVQWKHDNNKDDLKLFGALGVGAMRIELNEYEVVLDTGDGEKQRSQNIDAFIARQIGFVVPISALRHWVVGKYLQGEPIVPQEDGFQQLGWRVTYSQYMQTSLGVMPRKIEISKDKIKLKLVIDQWDIE